MNGTEGLHVGIIMDGNGRWAARQGLSRYRGHGAGARAVRACVRAAPDLGVRVLTLYAFSANNWQRPAREVSVLMRLFERHLNDEMDECMQNGVRVQVIGRRDRLGARLRGAIDAAERRTRHGERLLLRIAIDYSARAAILAAAARLPELTASGDEERSAAFGRLVASEPCECHPAQDVDLIIRTGGEQRLSDFLLWEGAYAELYFTQVMWPDFGRHELQAAIAEFRGRERRFGRIAAPAAPPAVPAVSRKPASAPPRHAASAGGATRSTVAAAAGA